MNAKEAIKKIARDPNTLDSLNPREFEEVAAEIFASAGYSVQLTPATRDGGYDLMVIHRDPLGIERTSIVECKKYNIENKVGVGLIRALYGVKTFLGVSDGILLTTSTFTQDSKRFVESKYDIKLIDRTELLIWCGAYKEPEYGDFHLSQRRFYSCFISHSSKDKAFVEKLNEYLRLNGVHVWYAPEDLLPGDKIYDQIKRAIESFDKLLLVLSEESIKSNWVITEILNARLKEDKEGNQVLFPMAITSMDKIKTWQCFDADSGKDVAKEVREYFIPDLSNWQDDESFRVNAAKLLRGLQQGNPSHNDDIKEYSERISKLRGRMYGECTFDD